MGVNLDFLDFLQKRNIITGTLGDADPVDNEGKVQIPTLATYLLKRSKQ